MKQTKTVVDRYVQAGIPYMDVMAYRDHQPLLRYGNGHTPVTGKETVYMYSCTKPMTMAAVIKLIEDGRLSLDTPVGDILPAYRNVFTEEAGVRRAPRTTMTIRHLMSMTAGLSYDFAHYPIDESLQNAEEETVTRAVVDGFARAPLYFDPGERYQYSLCHDVLGAVIEQVSGKHFGAFMKETFWGPLGMEQTRFGSPYEKDVAPQYIMRDGQAVPMETACPFIFTDGYESGGAGTVSCVEDYIKFADMYACGGVGIHGERLLREESINLLRTPQVGYAKGFSCFLGDQADYAYALGVRTRLHDARCGLGTGEFGWDGAAGCLLVADPKNHISIVVGMHLRDWYLYFRDVHKNIVEAVFEDIKRI